MSDRAAKPAFSSRPSDADAWVRTPDGLGASHQANTARLTIDVTPALRRRIKVTAFGRGLTVADMLRALLEREYPAPRDGSGAAP